MHNNGSTDRRGVIGGTEDELRCAIVSRADVRYIGLAFDQLLGAVRNGQQQSRKNATAGGECTFRSRITLARR